MPASTDGAISVRLDEMLIERGMTLTELARRIGITQANASILKTGKAKAVRFSTLSAICEVLDCQPGDLLRYDPNLHDAIESGAVGAGVNVVLVDAGDRPIAVVKEIRELTGAGLKEAKGLVDNVPSVVDRLERPDAEAMMVKLRAAGATVELT